MDSAMLQVMSDDDIINAPVEEKKEFLKSVGVKVHHAAGNTKINELVLNAREDLLNGKELGLLNVEEGKPVIDKGVQTLLNTPDEKLSSAQLRNKRKQQAGELVRVVVVNMNPNKKDIEGEVFTVSNSTLGTFRKYVPFGNDEGWHVPRIILNAMRDRKCQIFTVRKTKDGREIPESKLINEFAIEELPALTPDELRDLAQRQAMANGTDKQ